MPKTTEPKGVGDTLVRLSECSLEERLDAYQRLLRYGEIKTPEEAERMLAMVLDPGDRGGRIAA